MAVPARCVFAEPTHEPVATGARDIDLADLIAFHISPIEAFFRQRLQIWIPQEEQAHADELDITLGGLDEWGVGDRLLRRMLDGASLLDCQAAELRRGTLPPRMFGSRQLRTISDAVTDVHDAVVLLRRHATGDGGHRTADVLVPLADGRRIHGTIADVFGENIVTATFSKLRPKQRLAAWIGLLALAAAPTVGSGSAAPSVTSAVVVGRRRSRTGGLPCPGSVFPTIRYRFWKSLSRCVIWDCGRSCRSPRTWPPSSSSPAAVPAGWWGCRPRGDRSGTNTASRGTGSCGWPSAGCVGDRRLR